MHDLALRGKESNSGNFYDLLEFRVESGDEVLGNHLSIGSCSAKYTGPALEYAGPKAANYERGPRHKAADEE